MTRYLIIGAGIVGCTLAREILMRKMGAVTLLEKEADLGYHASGRNSCVVHSGINQKPESLKARLCLAGSQALREYCRTHRLPLEERGTLVTALEQKDLLGLETLKKMGDAVGVPNLRLLKPADFQAIEPRARGLCALHSPTGAVVDPLRILSRLAREVTDLGGRLVFNAKVRAVEGSTCRTFGAEAHSFDHLVNCAGLHADHIARLCGETLDMEIIPFRGDYYQLTEVAIRSMVYAVPDLRFPFLNVHLTRLTDGTVIAGPTAVLASGREAYGRSTDWREVFRRSHSLPFFRMAARRDFLKMAVHALKLSFSKKAFQAEVEKLVGPIRPDQLQPFRSGIRAQMVDSRGNLVHDLKVIFNPSVTHVLNVVSPGFTSSFAFAAYLADHLPQ